MSHSPCLVVTQAAMPDGMDVARGGGFTDLSRLHQWHAAWCHRIAGCEPCFAGCMYTSSMVCTPALAQCWPEHQHQTPIGVLHPGLLPAQVPATKDCIPLSDGVFHYVPDCCTLMCPISPPECPRWPWALTHRRVEPGPRDGEDSIL